MRKRRREEKKGSQSLSKPPQSLPKALQSLTKPPQSSPKSPQSCPKPSSSFPKLSPELPKASPKPPQISSGSPTAPRPKVRNQPSIYWGKIEGDLQKCCKVCKFENGSAISCVFLKGDLQKCNTYATLFLTLHSRSSPSDFFFARIDFPFGQARGEACELCERSGTKTYPENP